MNNEWKEYKLGEIAKVLDFMRVPLSSTQRANKKGRYPYYGASGIIDYVDDYIFDGQYVLISEDGENLRSRQTPIAFIAKGKFWVNNHAHILQADEIHNKLLCYYFANLDLNPYITGAVQPKLNQASLNNIPILLPKSLGKRKQIADILSSLDDKIALLNRQNATLESMAEALFRHHFIDNAKEDWKEVLITELFEVKDGTHDSPREKEFGNKLITSKHLSGNSIDFSSAYYISKEDYLQINQRSKVDTNDILFSMIGTIGRIYLEQSDKINYAIKNLGLFKTSQNKLWTYFSFLWLKSSAGFEFIQEHISGSTQEYISLGSLRSITFKVPEIEKIIEFNSHVNDFFIKIKSNQKQIITLTNLRDTLLPKLMSGEVRV